MSPHWKFKELHARARDVHALAIPRDIQRTIRTVMPTDSALVLGSTQPIDDVNQTVAQEFGVDIVRRRSGGGAVLVEPADLVWIDVLLPSNDALWSNDVGRAFYWLGEVFVDALRTLGVTDVQMHRGALVTTPWSKKVCFAGLGPGECTLAGKKILGISQRRTREGALFQASLNLRFDGAKLARLLSVPSEVMVEEIAPRVGALPDVEPKAFVASVLSSLDQH